MGDGYLVLCSYCIAVLDLASAFLFAIVSGMVYGKHGHWTSLAALIFTIFWMCIILMLLFGIYWRNMNLVRYWLVFTCLGILLDGIILIYGLTLAISVNWEGIKITLLPFMGLAVEMIFVYIIYIFYLVINQNDQLDRYVGGEDHNFSEYEVNDNDENYPYNDEEEEIQRNIEEHIKRKHIKTLTDEEEDQRGELQYDQSNI